MAQHLRYFFTNLQTLQIGLVFMLNSLIFGNWVTQIPNIKDALALSEAELGFALLGAPLGALAVMPAAGWLIARLQLGKTVWGSGMLHALSLPLLGLANSFWSLAIALVIFGLTNAIMDISMNAVAAATERKLQRNIMSTCHGMWSVGAMIGSGAGSILVGLRFGTWNHLASVSLVIVITLALFSKGLFAYHEDQKSGDKVLAWPNKSLVLLALMAFCMMVSEGGVADWSGVYMRDTLGANAYLTGIAYAGFALLMAIGRFAGDAIIPVFGKKLIVAIGGFLSMFGIALALLIGNPLIAIIGFSIAGLGYSCIVPILFVTAANEPGYSSGAGIASVTVIAYSGFLIGPPLIGFLAEAYTLSIGLGFIVLCSLLVGLLSMTVKFK